MRHGKHIHTAGDGRGPRDVFFNGKLVDRVMYADTRAGIVRVVGSPVKLDKWKKRVLTRTLRGTVEVRVKVGAGGTVHNAPHEGPGAASSRTVPLDAVVGRQNVTTE